MSHKEREHLLMTFLEHYENHREAYKKWNQQDVVKTFLESYKIHLFNVPLKEKKTSRRRS